MSTETEPRDERGRWTTGGGAHSEGPFVKLSDAANAEKAANVAHVAAQVARQLGYDPSKIRISDESRTFELNGTTRYYAGAASIPKRTELEGGRSMLTVWERDEKGEMKPAQIQSSDSGPITLYVSHIGSDEPTLRGLVAHEIEHQKYQAFINDYLDERMRMERDPDYVATLPKWEGDKIVNRGDDSFMRPDGSLKEPYASRYPVYEAYRQATTPSTADFAKTDGVSSYSRDWWDAWQNRTANTDQAMHETLAEIADTRQRGEQIIHFVRKPPPDEEGRSFLASRKGIDPNWNRLYKAVEANWKRRSKR